MEVGNDNNLARKLQESFTRFHRLNWKRSLGSSLKPSEIGLLFCIRKNTPPESRGLKISELSHILNFTPPTITQLVNGLETGGYLERNDDPVDRRVVLVQLTGRGEEVIATAYRVLQEHFQELVGFLGAEKSQLLIELLTEVFKYYEKQKTFDRQD